MYDITGTPHRSEDPDPAHLVRDFVEAFLNAGEIKSVKVDQELVETTTANDHKTFLPTGRFTMSIDLERVS